VLNTVDVMSAFGSLMLAGLLLVGCACASAEPPAGEAKLSGPLKNFIAARITEFDQIPTERKEQLKTLAQYVESCRKANRPARFTFICTHNSRRSHLAQLWAATAAAYYDIPAVETFSGGTEATAFNPRAVAALQRAGLKITKCSDDANPKYEVEIGEGIEPQICFSKVYDQAPNPQSDFCAVMTCSSADKSCPTVKGASLRMAIPYDDPKAFDGTPQEASKYDERCCQIAREMLYLFSLVNRSVQ
jgi:arsenate reductase (thioredoxin)